MHRHQILASCAQGRTLDIGFEAGHNSYLNGAIGLDLAVAKKPDNYSAAIEGDACRLPLKSQSVETVVAGEVLEHLEEPNLFLHESHRVLKDGGKLVISTPNSSSILILLANWLRIPLAADHWGEYSPRVVERMGRKAGFSERKKRGLLTPFILSPKRFKLRRRGFLRLPMWLSPLCHKLLYVFET